MSQTVTEMVSSRATDVRRRVAAAGRDPGEVRIVAVTKGFAPDMVEAAVAAGLSDVGENYARELCEKAVGAPVGVRWHFLGPVQRNKVPRLAPIVRTWHAIDRVSAAEAIAARRPGVEVLVQVNVAGSTTKQGCRPGDVEDLVGRCRRLPLDVSGLMAVGLAGDLDGSRQCFRWLADKGRRLGLRELSMGMSDDFEVAVAEGATTLRLGRVIFGSRPGGQAARG